jgi:hypothetical protein
LVASNKEKMSVVVLTGATVEMADVLDASIPSKLEYCRKYGYDLKVITLTGEDEVFGNRLGFERMNRAFGEVGEYDSCMWLDADAFVTNYDYPLSAFVTEDAPFIASLDWTDCDTISTGNFIIRNTFCTQNLYRHFVDFGLSRFIDHPHQEQVTMNHIRGAFPHFFLDLHRKYLNAVPEIAKKYRSDEEREIVFPWDETCFIAHLTTIPNDARVDIMKNNLLFSEKSIDQK